MVVEEKRSDRRQSGSFFLAGNFGLCSEIVGVLAWRYEHRIRRREDLLFSFGSERGPFPKDGGHLGCRPSLSPGWRISPGCPWIDNFRGFGVRFDNTFLLLLHGLFFSFAFCFRAHVSISTSTVFSAGFFSTAHVCTCTQHDHEDTSGPTRGIPINQQIGKKNSNRNSLYKRN